MWLLLHALPTGPAISSPVCSSVLFISSLLSIMNHPFDSTHHFYFLLFLNIYYSDARGSRNEHFIIDKSLSHMFIYNDAEGKWFLVSPMLICVTFLVSLILLMIWHLLGPFPHHKHVHSGLAPSSQSLESPTSLNLPSLNFSQNEHFMTLWRLTRFGLTQEIHPWLPERCT